MGERRAYRRWWFARDVAHHLGLRARAARRDVRRRTVRPGIVSLLGANLSSEIGPYLPSNAGQAFIASIREGDMLTPWAGLGVFTLWVLAALAVAVVAMRRRDA